VAAKFGKEGLTMRVEQIQNVLVVGAGTMGEGLVQTFAQGGLGVNMVDKDQAILERCLKQILANLNQFQKFGLLSEKPASIMARIKSFPSEKLSEAAGNCQFVMESVIEVLEVKKELLARLDSLPGDVVIASNSGSINVSTMAENMKTPERVVGTHFFNPANIIPLVEIHRGSRTTDQAVEITRQIMIKVGKKPVLVRKEMPGFIINRLTGAMEREVNYLIDEGVVTPQDLDEAVKASFGFRLSCLGPKEAEDQIGLDTSAKVSERVYKTLSNRTEPSSTLLDKVKRGELGLKSGKGWYDYSGKTRQQVIEERNEILLQQLALYRSREKK
jgi:3-hydroxybutyryl-CoA dehydrogenase